MNYTMKAKKYSRALISHLQWKVKLKAFLDGRGHFDIDELSAENCKFGKWLRSHEITKYASSTEIREIEKLHIKIHERAKRVYALRMLGEDSKAKQQFQKMEASSMKLASLLSILKVISEN